METLFIILYTLLLALIFLFLLIKGTNFNIKVTVEQTFNAEELQKLQDIYEKDGNVKNEYVMPNMDEAIKAINDVMLGEDNNE